MKFFDLFKKAEKRDRGMDGWPSGLPGTLATYDASPHMAENLAAV